MSTDKLESIKELNVELLCSSELSKQVSTFLYSVWDQERSGQRNSPDIDQLNTLSLQMVLQERLGQVKTHGLMSYLASLGLPDQLWQAGYCLWAHIDHAIRGYISAKDKLIEHLAVLAKDCAIPGVIVDTLMELKGYHKELQDFGIISSDVEFITIMRGLKAYCSPDILSEIIDQELELEHYGELRQKLVNSMRKVDQPLSPEQIELVDELVLSQCALSKSGVNVNQSQDIGELVSHLDQCSALMVSLKEHLTSKHGIEEIILDSGDWQVEPDQLDEKHISFSAISNGLKDKQAKQNIKFLGVAAAIAALTVAWLMGSTAAERDMVANIEEVPVTADFDEVEDHGLELMVYEDSDGI